MYRRKFFFGKHKGEFILDVIENDTQYITWCMEHVSYLRLNETEINAYNIKIKSINNDINRSNIRHRSSLEEKMYSIFKQGY